MWIDREVAGRPPRFMLEHRNVGEQAAIVQSLANLLSFTWVRERVADGRLALHGWYFDLPAGRLMAYDPAFGKQMAVAERIMRENRDVLRKLADS